jgi:hypothetical protein
MDMDDTQIKTSVEIWVNLWLNPWRPPRLGGFIYSMFPSGFLAVKERCPGGPKFQAARSLVSNASLQAGHTPWVMRGSRA